MIRANAVRLIRVGTQSLCLAGLAASLSGCLATFSPPERLFPVAVEMEALRKPELLPDFAYYGQLSEPQRVLYRNALIEARLRAADIQYSAYEAALTEERQASDLLAGAATIALTGTSALITPVATKDILTQIAGGVTGFNGVFNDKVLRSKTIQILQHQMRAERDRIATNIFDGMKLSSSRFSLALALSRTEDYYRAGTLAGALIDMAETVSKEAAEAKEAKDSFVTASVIDDPRAPIRPPPKFGPPRDDFRFNAVERALQGKQIVAFQTLVCVRPTTGTLGPHGSATRKAIRDYLVGKNLKDKSEDDTITDDDRINLIQEIRAGSKCATN